MTINTISTWRRDRAALRATTLTAHEALADEMSAERRPLFLALAQSFISAFDAETEAGERLASFVDSAAAPAAPTLPPLPRIALDAYIALRDARAALLSAALAGVYSAPWVEGMFEARYLAATKGAEEAAWQALLKQRDALPREARLQARLRSAVRKGANALDTHMIETPTALLDVVEVLHMGETLLAEVEAWFRADPHGWVRMEAAHRRLPDHIFCVARRAALKAFDRALDAPSPADSAVTPALLARAERLYRAASRPEDVEDEWGSLAVSARALRLKGWAI